MAVSPSRAASPWCRSSSRAGSSPAPNKWGCIPPFRPRGFSARAPTLRFAERLAAMNKPAWVRFTLVPGLTDDPDNVEKVARFVAPMKNVQWVEVQPFHQLGAFKWEAMKLGYKQADTLPATTELVDRVLGQFRAAGCRAR